ncbi:MAG: type II toxin-antitoxin system PrlF family antitoxin [Terracidiphilus sp.]
MPTLKARKPSVTNQQTAYRGKLTKTGNSSGFRFEGALFKSHPEFNGAVKAQIIAPGRMLVTAENAPQKRADPVLASFLAFLAQDIARNPHHIRPLDEKLMKRIDKLTKGVAVNPNEDLGDAAIL